MAVSTKNMEIEKEIDSLYRFTTNSEVAELLAKTYFTNPKFCEFVRDEAKKSREDFNRNPPSDLGDLVVTDRQVVEIFQDAKRAVHNVLGLEQIAVEPNVRLYRYLTFDNVCVAAVTSLMGHGLFYYTNEFQRMFSGNVEWYKYGIIPIVGLVGLNLVFGGIGFLLDQRNLTAKYKPKAKLPFLKAFKGKIETKIKPYEVCFVSLCHEYAHFLNDYFSRSYRSFEYSSPSIIKEGIADYITFAAVKYQAEQENNSGLRYLTAERRCFAFTTAENIVNLAKISAKLLKRELYLFDYMTTQNCYILGAVVVDFLSQEKFGGLDNLRSLMKGDYKPLLHNIN